MSNLHSVAKTKQNKNTIFKKDNCREICTQFSPKDISYALKIANHSHNMSIIIMLKQQLAVLEKGHPEVNVCFQFPTAPKLTHSTSKMKASTHRQKREGDSEV